MREASLQHCDEQRVLTLATVVSGEIERTLAVETGRQIDASRAWCARCLLAVDDVVFAIFASESCRADARVAGAVVNARGAILANASITCIELVLATDARVVVGTRTIQAGAVVSAFAAVHARTADAAFGCCFALFAVGATRTHAEVVFEQIDTRCVILARMLHRARFDFLLALLARPAIFADALVRADAIDAFAAIQARLILAVVDVRLTVDTRESFTTVAGKLVVQIEAAFGADGVARIDQALIDFGFALQSNETRSTFTNESIDFIDTRRAILTRLALAIVNGVLAILAGVARLTVARVSIDQVNASAFIRARIFGAIVDIDVAVVARPAGVADALVVE